MFQPSAIRGWRMQGSEEHRQRAFSVWLRTGRRVRFPDDRAIERKFNPWHDPDDGRFTFAGAGVSSGRSGGGSAKPSRRLTPQVRYDEDSTMAPLKSMAEVDVWKARELAKHRGEPGYAEAIEAQYRRYQQAFASQPESALSQVARITTGFASGVGAAARDSGKETATELYSAATTNPVTTIGNVGRGIASTIDGAISAEDTPASVQISRAASAIAHASAPDIGYAFGTAGLVLAPGAIAGKLARLGRLGKRIERVAAAEEAGPKVIWVDENNGLKDLPKDYNDSATGARSNVVTRRGQAPALERTMPDGTTRLVKFDGVEGNVMTDRKWSIARSRKAKDQALRQSDVLKQHGLIGIWEVPTEPERKQAVRLLEKLKISNIKVRIVKPW
jgi:hypothetical protein